ncbi:MAG: phage tail tube protein [Thermodesulfobacteriota bacterium]|nr:phage tail tube protein [Thermodesulfobacteriota bacterium]
MALESQGVEFFWSETTSLSTSVKIGEVTGFNGPTGSAAVIDVTHLDSTAKEKMMGLRDEGQITLDCNLVASNTGQINLRTDRADRNLRKACVKLNDTSSYQLQFDAYVTGFAISGAVDGKMTCGVTLEITGAVTWSTA